MAEYIQNNSEISRQPNFIQAYQELKVPVFHDFRDLDDVRLQNRINRFFIDTVNALQLNDLMEDAYITYEQVDVKGDEGDVRSRLRTLSLRDFQVLTTVTTVVHNDQLYTRAEKNALTPESVEAIKGYHEGDGHLTDILFRPER